MSPNPAIRCQKERFSARFRICATGRKGGNKSRSVKKRAGELSVWNISPPRRPFPCGKNGISFRKEISFLPQSRKEIPGHVESGEKRGFGRLFPSNWRLSAHKIHLSFCKHFPSRADAGAALVRTASRGGRQNVAESGFRLSSCIPATVRESRIPVRPRPCIRPRDSRGAGFDVLTECHPGFSGGKRMSPAGVSPGGYGIKAS